MKDQRSTVLAALAVSTVLLVGGCAHHSTDPSNVEHSDPAVPRVTAAGPHDTTAETSAVPGGSAVVVPDVPVRPARDQPSASPPAPVRVAFPDVDVDVPVSAQGVDERGRMALPATSRSAGWYKFGSAPSSASGTTVIAAHVDDAEGVGPFARLREARAGQRVTVIDANKVTYTYAVTEVRSIPKADIPTSGLFDRDGAARLVLVTCGGTWDREQRSYSDNVVVTATRVA